MGLIKGGFKRLLQSALYLLAFCCAGIILGIYSYFLSVQADRNTAIPKWQKAVEGISGIAVVYTIFAVLLTCCLGGVSFFAFVAIVIDVCMVGGFIALAVLTRSGAHSCKGNVNTPLGSGPAGASGSGFGSGGFGSSGDSNTTYAAGLGLACRLNTAAFAVSIIGAFLFVLTALMQVALVRHHKKEKRFGPSPANNYTSGTGKRSLFGRKKAKNVDAGNHHDAELGAVGAGAGATGLAANHHHNKQTDFRPSHDTAYTGSTVASPQHNTGLVTDADPIPHGHAPHGSHGGYYTQPQGTGVNPYGYDDNTTQAYEGAVPQHSNAGRHFGHTAPATGTAQNF